MSKISKDKYDELEEKYINATLLMEELQKQNIKLMMFADIIIGDANRCRNWHQQKGMKPAWVPPMNTAVALRILNEAKRWDLVDENLKWKEKEDEL